jgi:hypothetical protein
MAAKPMIRIVRCRPLGVGFDTALREALVPDARESAGLLDLIAGRHGPDEQGSRIVAWVWESAAAMATPFGGSAGGTQVPPLDNVADLEVETMPLRIVFRGPGTEKPRIVRAFRGQVRASQLDAYVEEARIGTLRDSEAGTGPLALYLAAATDESDTVLTLSTWLDWGAIEVATGGDIRQPVATRHPERLAAWEAIHYEAIET